VALMTPGKPRRRYSGAFGGGWGTDCVRAPTKCIG
jgi:hypothetical protein